MRAFPKPSEVENHVHLTPDERRAKRKELYMAQFGMCACCGEPMSPYPGRMDSCTLDHIEPQPMGHSKNDADSNLQALRFDAT